jgi:dTDP-4-dehydrorhamnose 3,5-epimerase
MHYQDKPFAQNKLILVHQGSIIDLAIDLSKKETDKVLRYELLSGDAIFIPEGFAHGFLSLTDNVLLQYFMDDKFSQENYKGCSIKKYLKKEFPSLDIIISEKDSNLSDRKP